MSIIVHENRCESCHEPSGEKVGSPCPMDCEHSRVVRAIGCGRYEVEISAHGDEFKATGLIGENLSREFGVRDFKKFSHAEHSALKWINKKCQD